MIPGEVHVEDFNFSGGELRLYELLKQLPDTYYIFHSTSWNEKRRQAEWSRNDYVVWGESDFTIFHPDHGIIVFEVKDGQISYSRERGWQQQNRRTGHQEYIDPMAQAEKSKYYFLRLLKKNFNDKSPYPLCSAVWFTSGDSQCVEGTMPHCYKDDLVLWSNNLSSPTAAEQAIKRVFKYYSAEPATRTEDVVDKVVRLIAPEFGVFQSLRSRSIASKALFHKMTLEQSYLLDYLEEQNEAAIHGVAGTGKTVLAVQKAQRLAEQGKVLFLCFNRFLKENLEQTYHDNNIDFYNLDGLLVKKTSSPLPAPSRDKDEAVFDFLMDWNSYSWEYKHIVIDEGQDFKDMHLQALHEIAEAQGGCFYVFYDRNQFVQGIRYPEWLDKMECRLVLSRNCRNTKEIAITSTRPIGIDQEKIKMRRDDLSSLYTTPPKPTFFFSADVIYLKTCLIKLLKKYTSAGIRKENIVILSCKSEGASCLQESDFQLTSSYRLSKKRTDGCILFTTVRKFKGLEADAVICVDIDSDTFKSEKEQNAFYVGTSRATTCLDLFSLSDANQICSAMTNDSSLSGPRALKAIRDRLCVKIGGEADLDS